MPVVKLYANLRKLAGRKEVSISAETARDVLAGLVRQYPGLMPALLEDGQLRPHVVLTKNGQILTALDVSTAEKDEIAIFPPMAGG